MRYTQTQVLMSDPNWKRGFYYDSVPPHVGMKLSREIATITYRSGPEWEIRFGRERANPEDSPALCPDFLVETYLSHQGNKFSLEYDPNSLLYISKAMDLFDLGAKNRVSAHVKRTKTKEIVENDGFRRIAPNEVCPVITQTHEPTKKRTESREESELDLLNGLKPVSNKDVLVIGVKSDILFPHWQQEEIAKKLQQGNVEFFGGDGSNIKLVELGEEISMFGHDTFLLDLQHVGGPIKEFLN
jgi:homoserine O-acetyltransferase